MSRLLALQRNGQSVWLDFIERNLMQTGQLAKMIEEDGICGLTSNPAIFQKAIGSTDQYDVDIALHLKNSDAEPVELFEAIAIEDIRRAADVMRPVYDSTDGRDGYVSLEVSPHLANDTSGTLDSARRLWKAVDRPNLMIKVPGTPQGVDAVRQLIVDGINVNVTLLFARDAYRAVAQAYIEGISQRAAAGAPVVRVASVASFFVSRIDAAIDELLDSRIAATDDLQKKATLRGLLGKLAIANAKLAYQDYMEIFERSERWKTLVNNHGAKVQRLLWASTGTKNPNYRDVVYMEALVGNNTVNTVPPATLDAFRDHGNSKSVLQEDVSAARNTVAELTRIGISLDAVTDKLLIDGLQLFVDADNQLMAAIADKRKQVLATRSLQVSFQLGASLRSELEAETKEWTNIGKLRRLWERDARLWTGSDESKWMDWLYCPFWPPGNLLSLIQLFTEVRDEGFTTALLIGMGGSSLGPEVLSKTLRPHEFGLTLHVLDSTDPTHIARFTSQLDLSHTLFVVASKSGSTLEPEILMRYFYDRAMSALGAAAPSHFVAVTDPGSKLEAFAHEQGFRHIFAGIPGIGGRYSVLSNFGLVPAVLMGVSAQAFLDEAGIMANSCGATVPPLQNPGVQLGLALGLAAKGGRDKLTLFASPQLESFGAWIEQLIAESTGKNGTGIIPVDRESIGSPSQYGNDRVFVYLELENDPTASDDAKMVKLQEASHPVIRMRLSSPEQIAQAFYLWEFATAVAGSVLRIHPFDQPDVEAAKVQTKRLMSAYETNKALPDEIPGWSDGQFTIYGVERKDGSNLEGSVQALLTQLCPGDYFALLAFIPMNEATQALLHEMRLIVRDACRVATCVGFGPRFLHSTGQLYKGGPNTGVFLQITCDDPHDLEIPGRPYSFGTVKAAQALGDLKVLLDRQRRILRVHIGGDLMHGLVTLSSCVAAVVQRQSD